jgi:flagellin-specific chaperone FliS
MAVVPNENKYNSGRFAYQPLSEEFAKQSQPGQLIMNRFDGHISANRNGIIVSKTKEIEDKIEDINEFKHDVDEQTDVVTNLIEDLKKFLETDFQKAYDQQNKTYEYDKRLLTQVLYLDNLQKAMGRKLDRIRDIIRDLERANDLQLSWLDSWESESDETLKTIGDFAYVETEFSNVMALKLIYL